MVFFPEWVGGFWVPGSDPRGRLKDNHCYQIFECVRMMSEQWSNAQALKQKK